MLSVESDLCFLAKLVSPRDYRDGEVEHKKENKTTLNQIINTTRST